MLKGLEITIFNKSDILIDNEEFRIDAEYYRKEFLKLYRNIQNAPILENLVYMSDLSTNGSFKTVSNIVNDDNPKIIPFIRSGNTGSPFIKTSELIFISKEAHKRLPKSTTHLHDIIMARKGKIGGASLITEDEVNFNCNENVIKLDINDKEYLNPFYFTTYFNSKYGLKQIERLSTGNVQPWVSIFQIRKLKIPILKPLFQQKIEIVFKNAHSSISNSKKNYKKAETLLLEEIGLQDFTPSKEPVNIKNFKDSFGTSGRLDAEYYQLKYEQVVNKVKSKPYDVLSNIVDIKKSIEPGSKNYVENGLPFMRVADLSKNGLSEPQKFISEHFVQANKDKIRDLKPKKGTILFSKDGTVGIAYHLRQDYKGITSGAILHLNVKDENRIIPEYLTLALNSKIVQMQAERDAGGSIILHWRSSEIENVVVPIIDYDKQQQISNLIEESFALKKQSEQLLEVAKKAVEIAIEENDEVALNYIKENE